MSARTTNTTALVAVEGLSDELRALVAAACDETGIAPEFRDLHAAVGAASVPALVLAVLPSGRRHVGAEVERAATSQMGAAPLVLLCEEPLVDGAASLSDGRVTLIGAPITKATLKHRLRVALRRPHAAPPTNDVAKVEVHERRDAACWVGTVRAARLAWHIEATEGGVAVHAAPPEADAPPVVRYERATRHWSFEPRGELLGVGLVSARRAPRVTWFEPAERTRHALSAASGDVLVACFARQGDIHARQSARFVEALTATGSGGGPEVLEQLARALSASDAACDAVVLEVR
ncbi:MAG: hypothetical protein L6Q99_04060 [Planctomycetes bacterium]|nr:hypothetical protein [Planctomycetota bacterium]